MAKGITINKENFKHVYRKIVQRNISDKELRNRLSELGKQCTPSKLKDFSDVDREMVVELKDIYNILQKKHPQSIVGTSEYYELMSKTKKYEKGGSIDFDAKEFTISDLKKKVKELFPDSFGISLFYPDKTKSINDISPDLKQGHYGIDEKSLNGKFYFPQYSVDHFINFKITQGDENTYFDFIIQKESGDLLIAHFGFKDYEVGPEAISDFIQFLLNSYGAPKGTKYQYGGKTYYAKGGNIYTSDTMYVAKVYTFPNNVLKLEKNIRAKDVKQVNQIIEDDYMDTWKNKYGNDLHVIVEEAPDLTKKAKGGNVDLDAEIKAKRPGYRIPGSNKVPSKAEIKAGKAYYENRFNRSDDNRRTYPYLEKGGVIDVIDVKYTTNEDGIFEWLIIDEASARKIYNMDHEVFILYDDDSEALIESLDDIDGSKTYALAKSDLPSKFKLSGRKLKYEDGGETDDEKDLFEFYDEQPAELQAILAKRKYKPFFIDGDGDYKLAQHLLRETEAIGYTFEYGLDGLPYGLRKMTSEEVKQHSENLKNYVPDPEIESKIKKNSFTLPINKMANDIDSYDSMAIYISKADAISLLNKEDFNIVLYRKLPDGSVEEIETPEEVMESKQVLLFEHNLPNGFDIEDNKLVYTPIYAKGGDVDSSPKIYIEYLDKKKGFQRTKKYFKDETQAQTWASKNLGNYHPDMIRYEFAKGGKTQKSSIFTGEVGLPYNAKIDGVEYIGINYPSAVELLEGMEVNLYLINEDEQVIDVEYKEDLNEDGIIVIKAEDINKLAKGGNVDLDAQIKAKRPGYRIPGTNKVPSKAEIKSGQAYYENRFNRSDDNRRTYPYLEKGGQLVTSKTLKGLDFSKIKFPANNSVKRVFHHSINPKLKSLQNDRYTGYTENSYTYGPMGNHKQSSLMRFIDRSKLNLATEKQVWGLKSGADWDELLVLADKKGYDGVAYKVYGDNADILFDNSNAMLPETYVANLYNESKSKNQNNAFVNQIDSMLSANQKFERGGDISSSVAQIAYYTGLNAKAIREFAQKHDISSQGLDKIAKGLKKKEILFMDVTTAVVGKPDNKYQRQIIKYAKGTNNKMAMGGSVPSSLIKSNKHRND